MDAFERVKKTVEEHGMISKGDTVVVGFSGGPDSLCLLHCLTRLFGSFSEPAGKGEERGGRLYAVHVNHQLRGSASDGDQAFVEEYCREQGIPCDVYRFDVAGKAAAEGLSAEDAGRRLRYQAFEETRKRLILERQRQGGAEADREAYPGKILIAVAQNANDQAETVLMRLLRGTGPKGLGAMDYVRKDGVIRPLLDVTRDQVEDYCRGQRLHPRVDHTNLEPHYTRNRIRLELLPYIRENFNENIVEALNRLAEMARQDEAFFDGVVRSLMETGLKDRVPGEGDREERECRNGNRLSFPLGLLRSQPASLRRRLILLLLDRLGLSRNVGAVHVVQMERLIAEGRTSAEVALPQGYRMRISYDSVIFEKSGELLWGTAQLKSSVLSPQELGNPAELPADRRAFDRDALEAVGFTPTLRTRRPGDFIRPLGMKGTKKLQDYFVDKKIPREERDSLPLVCLGSEVIWVTGDRGTVGEPYKVNEQTRQVVMLQIQYL